MILTTIVTNPMSHFTLLFIYNSILRFQNPTSFYYRPNVPFWIYRKVR